VYVKDVVDGYILLMENISRMKGEAINFSTGYNFSVLDLIEKISKITGKKCKYKIANNQKNEIASQSLNYDKATKILGWKSKYTVPSKRLFRDYIYFSSTSKSYLEHCEKNAKQLVKKLKLNSKNLVLEIASNDGAQLQFFKHLGVNVLGVDPALNIATIANK